MIKINLTPPDELESKFWYLPEALGCIVAAFIFYSGVSIYFDYIKDEINENQKQIAEYQKSYNALADDLARFSSLDADIKDLDSKISSLKEIISSKFVKYKILITLEHLHNLKPEGVWFSEIHIKNLIDVSYKAYALDNILVAEYLSSLEATKNQVVNNSDVRSYIYFEDVKLIRSVAEKDSVFSLGLGKPVSVEIRARVSEHQKPTNVLQSDPVSALFPSVQGRM